MTARELSALVKETIDEWSNHNVPRLGAALAYYAVLSMAPLLIVIVAVAGLAFGQKAAEGQIVWQIQGLVGYQMAESIQGILRSASGPGKGIAATVVGVVTLVLGASLVVSELRSSLNLIWQVPTRSSDAGLLRELVRMVQYRFWSFLMVLGAGFLILLSLVFSAVLAGLGKNFQQWVTIPPQALVAMNSIFLLAVTILVFALIYKILPDVTMDWSDVAVGAVVTSVLFTIGRYLIALYLGRSTVTSAYGAAGSVVLILVWVYYSAQIFFLGAEFTYVYANRFGSRFRKRLASLSEAGAAEREAAGRPL